MYDIIGDVHGHADKLIQLLEKLGYYPHNGTYRHFERQAIFVGDWIDRGPQIRETLTIVRTMIEHGNALAVLGNHEYNALNFAVEYPAGGYLRPHTIKNIHQHYQTLYQFRNHVEEWESHLTWFLTIPLWLDLTSLRVVHACWDADNINLLRSKLPDGKLTVSRLHEAADSQNPLAKAIEETLKGKESRLPNGRFFVDADGHIRYESRVKWWVKPSSGRTYGDYFFDAPDGIASLPVDDALYTDNKQASFKNKPLFFGHYWLAGTPGLTADYAVCVDFSVAKGGVLTAYRWQGEDKLTVDNMVWV